MNLQTSIPASGRSVLSRFVECSQRFSDKPAIGVADRLYSYAELTALSAGIRALLQSQGIKRGDRVGLFIEDNVYTYASLLGILSWGACYVPLNPSNPVERNLSIVADAGMSVLLHTEKDEEARQLTQAPGSHCRAVSNRVDPLPGAFNPVVHTPDDLCYLLFTSGTTGKPKGVPIYHRNLAAFLDMMLESGKYDFHDADRFLQMFELTFDLSVFSYLVPLSVGASFYPLPRKGIAYLEAADILDSRQISVALMVPSVINYLKPYFGEIRLPRMRYSLFCGEALYHETLSGWASCVPEAKIENLYGPTEATIFCLRYEWRHGDPPHPLGKGIVPIGRPMEGMDAFKAGGGGPEEEGELCLSGGQVTSGYWNNSAKTADAFGVTPEGTKYYRTGDLCKVDQHGDFLYLGRIDNQVKIDGHRVELEEIEFHAREFCDGKQVVATVSSEQGFHVIRLFVETEETLDKGLEEHLKKHLPEYMLPRETVAVERFPLNSNGKTDRKAILNMHLKNRQAA